MTTESANNNWNALSDEEVSELRELMGDKWITDLVAMWSPSAEWRLRLRADLGRVPTHILRHLIWAQRELASLKEPTDLELSQLSAPPSPSDPNLSPFHLGTPSVATEAIGKLSAAEVAKIREIMGDEWLIRATGGADNWGAPVGGPIGPRNRDDVEIADRIGPLTTRLARAVIAYQSAYNGCSSNEAALRDILSAKPQESLLGAAKRVVAERNQAKGELQKANDLVAAGAKVEASLQRNLRAAHAAKAPAIIQCVALNGAPLPGGGVSVRPGEAVYVQEVDGERKVVVKPLEEELRETTEKLNEAIGKWISSASVVDQLRRELDKKEEAFVVVEGQLAKANDEIARCYELQDIAARILAVERKT